MELNQNNRNILTGKESFDHLSALPSLPPFSEEVVNLLSAVSKELLTDPASKAYPDVVTLGFFCRKKHIQQMKQQYGAALDNRLGKGITFHVAPSNVPINFAYSLISGLLAGNACIVKLSSKEFPQTKLILEAIQRGAVESQTTHLLTYISFVQYDREEVEITKKLSLLCQVRLIWGGDETISKIRQCPLPPRGSDITFADRYSFALFHAKSVAETQDILGLCAGFYNDTYLFDQNACTAPHFICWLGENTDITLGKERFWTEFSQYAQKKYPVAPIVAVDKYSNACRAAIELDGVKVKNQGSNLITRLELDTLTSSLPEFRAVGGTFFEYKAKNLEELFPIITQQYQTMSYFGGDSEEICEKIMKAGLKGVDRIVPVGKTMDFELTWDGVDLVGAMTRIIISR